MRVLQGHHRGFVRLDAKRKCILFLSEFCKGFKKGFIRCKERLYKFFLKV